MKTIDEIIEKEFGRELPPHRKLRLKYIMLQYGLDMYYDTMLADEAHEDFEQLVKEQKKTSPF